MLMVIKQENIHNEKQVISWIEDIIELIPKRTIMANQPLKSEYFDIPSDLTIDKAIKALTNELKQWSKLEPSFDSIVGTTAITEIDNEYDQTMAMFYMAMLLKIIRKNQNTN